MPRDKDFKRRVRARMQKTGEAYTTARTRLLEKSHRHEAAPPAPAEVPPETPASASAPATAQPPEPPPDYAAVAGMADTRLEARTGRSWADWVAVLDGHDAARLEHRDIARLVHEQYGVDGWWSQTVTVGYERIRGLRERGQRRSGSYETNRSRTFAVPVGTLFDACADEATRRRWLAGAEHRMTTARRPRSIRLRWADGTLVALWFTEKGDAKSVLSVQHTKLPDRSAAERSREHWSGRLAALAGLLPSR